MEIYFIIILHRMIWNFNYWIMIMINTKQENYSYNHVGHSAVHTFHDLGYLAIIKISPIVKTI